MNVILVNDLTQTVGYGNILKEVFILKMDPEKEPLMEDGFKSYDDYLEYYNSGDKRGKSRLKTKLDNLKKSLEIRFGRYVDPIIYLANLYYGEGLSIIDTHNRIKNIGMNNSNESSLGETFKLTFGWVLRDAGGSEITRKKTKGNIDNAKVAYAEDVEKKYEKIRNFVSDNIYKILSRKKSNFDKKHYSGLENNGLRMLYVIEVFLGLKKDDIIEINKLGPGSRVIANYFEKRLAIYVKNYDLNLKIFPKYIQAILNEVK